MTLSTDLQTQAERFLQQALSLPISDENLRAIGQVVVRFNLLEGGLSLLIWILSGVEQDIRYIITAGLSFRNLLDIFSSLCRYKLDEPEAINRLNELIKRLVQAGEKRNQVVHSVWAGNLYGAALRSKATARARKGFKLQFEATETEELDAIASFIGEVAKDVGAFYKSHFMPQGS